MRFLTRLHACVATVIVVILYFSWLQPSLRVQDSIQRVWKGTAHRVVVFGDDWSDTGNYRVAAPPKATIRNRDPSSGKIWVETLCDALDCDFIDNFARSIPNNVGISTVGSMIDSNVYANATSGERNETLALFDFKTQVQQFITFDKETRRQHLPNHIRQVDEWTVFTIFFGLWELLEYSMLEKDAAIHAIDRSVEELIHNLDILADHMNGPVKVVMPTPMDVTFLPHYSNRKGGSTTMFAQVHHQAVFLWTYWNMILSRAASEWGNGELFMPDVHGMVINQVRLKQLHSKQILDAEGQGKQKPLFDEVEQPCLPPNADDKDQRPDMHESEANRCSDPATHLFWDDLRLSGAAHQLIGQDAAALVRGNNTVNHDARVQAMLHGSTQGGQSKHIGFDLKFPPGY